MSNNTEDKIEQLIEYLQGSCKTLGEGCEEIGLDEDDLTTEQLEQLDEAIFRCTECGWWWEQPANEINGEWVCDECNEETEE